ncbi:MAG: hypothetical protein ACFB11_00700 [Paracoccaceae bacterium]
MELSELREGLVEILDRHTEAVAEADKIAEEATFELVEQAIGEGMSTKGVARIVKDVQLKSLAHYPEKIGEAS